MTNRMIIAAVIMVSGAVATSAIAEQDHLNGYRIKDGNSVLPPANPYVLTTQFGNETCELKKPHLYLSQSEKAGGDDPRGGQAGDFVCYKARCTGPLPPTTDGVTQFGTHSLQPKRTKVVCLPMNPVICGDGNVDPGETCDGVADAACPGFCQPDCTCQPNVCGNNVREGAEICDGTDASACPNDCLPDCACASPCPNTNEACRARLTIEACVLCCVGPCAVGCSNAAANLCGPGGDLQGCTAAVNAAGCAAECCPRD